MSDIKIRRMEPRDISPVLSMIKQNWDEESETLAAKEIISAFAGATPQPIYFVAVLDTAIIGAIGICDSHMDTRIYEIFWVNVHPTWQDSGVGRLLVTHALEFADCEDAALVILTTKPKTLPFYQKLGFHILAPSYPEKLLESDFLMQAKPREAVAFIAMRERTVE